MADYPFTEEDVTRALDALGNDADEVAASLHRLGITGIQHDCYHCPIASYLASLYPDTDVHVERSCTRLDRTVRSKDENGYEDVTSERVEVENPYPVQDFIGEFDRDDCRHPYLKRKAKP